MKKRLTTKEKFLKLISKEKSNLLRTINWRIKNSYWLDSSALIAIKILTALEEQKLDKNDLNQLTNMSKVKINKMLKGNYNFSVKELRKLETALKIKILLA